MQKDFEYKNHLSDIEHVTSILTVGKEGAIPPPVVSVIMPVYNHPDFFRKSLLSVLNQKCDFEYEVVIVDNCHPDFQERNQQIVEELYCDKIRYYINEKNIGGVGSENRGLQLARAEYITYCHDDDILYDDALQTLFEEIKNCSCKDSAIFGDISAIDENDNPINRESVWDSFILKGRKRYKVSMYDFLIKNLSNGCGTLYNRDKLISVGGFCKDYIPCPDYALNVKYTQVNGAYHIRKKTLRYRVSPQGDSSSAYKYIVGMDQTIKFSILKTLPAPTTFFKFLIRANIRVSNYHLYNEFDKVKPSAVNIFFERVVNRIWIIVAIFLKRSRSS